MKPQPTEAEIQFILDAISEYLTVKARSLLCRRSKTLCSINNYHARPRFEVRFEACANSERRNAADMSWAS